MGRLCRGVAVVAGILIGIGGAVGRATAAPLGNGFTYQGQLRESGMPSNGSCDFQFSLWDAEGSGDPPAGGNQVGSRHTLSPVSVVDGLFTVQLNSGDEFGPTPFTGEDRWLQIAVRCPSGSGAYATLTPRQKLTAAPYALYAPSAASAADVNCTGCVSANVLANGAVTASKIAGGTIQQSNLAFTPGTVTSVTAGTGLSGGTITTSGIIAANFGTTSGTVAAGNHDHFGQLWSASGPGQSGLSVTNSSSSPGSNAVVGLQGTPMDLTTGLGGAAGIAFPPAGLLGISADGNGVYGQTFSGAGAGVLGTASTGTGLGVSGSSFSGTGVSGVTTTGLDGVYGRSDLNRAGEGGYGVHGDGTAGNLSTGVFGEARGGWGVQGTASSGIGVSGSSTFGNGVLASGGGGGRDAAALRSNNTNTSIGMAAYFTNQSSFATAHLANAGSGQVLYLQNGGTDVNGSAGGDFITCVNNPPNDTQFRVLSNGEARSDVGFNTPAADVAEMLPAVAGLEAGDVLVIGADGELERSTLPNQTSVAGVYSTNPGFVGGKAMDGDTSGMVPLAIVGVVPVKACTENGAIHPGDLLTASATPGYAMKADVQPSIGTVIGKALEPLAAGSGRIRTLVTLH